MKLTKKEMEDIKSKTGLKDRQVQERADMLSGFGFSKATILKSGLLGLTPSTAVKRFSYLVGLGMSERRIHANPQLLSRTRMEMQNTIDALAAKGMEQKEMVNKPKLLMQKLRARTAAHGSRRKR